MLKTPKQQAFAFRLSLAHVKAIHFDKQFILSFWHQMVEPTFPQQAHI